MSIELPVLLWCRSEYFRTLWAKEVGFELSEVKRVRSLEALHGRLHTMLFIDPQVTIVDWAEVKDYCHQHDIKLVQI